MEIKGQLKHICKPVTREYDGKTYTTQKILVLVPDAKYPQVIPIELIEKMQDQADSWTVGNEITVHVNMKGREYSSKTTNEPDAFLTLSAWKVETAVTTQANKAIQAEVATPSYAPFTDDTKDNLPF